jgi:hypothetical protein
MRRVGCLYAFLENDPIAQARVTVFREGLAQLGWTERNVRIEERFAGGDADQMQAYAAELVGSAPDVIVANSTPVVAALKQATSSTIQPDRVSSTAWGIWVATSRAFHLSSSRCSGNGWKCLRRLPQRQTDGARVQPADSALLPCLPARFQSGPGNARRRTFCNAGAWRGGNRGAVSVFAREPDGGLIVTPDPL